MFVAMWRHLTNGALQCVDGKKGGKPAVRAAVV
jgi:hypothetical protein